MSRIRIGTLIAAFGIGIASMAASWAPAATTVADATYRLDTYALELDGDAQFVGSLAGGFTDGTVVAAAEGIMPKKHIGGTVIEPIRTRVRVDQFTRFVSDSLAGKAQAGSAGVSGAIYYIDNSGKVQQQRAFTGVRLHELAFPGFTGSAAAGDALLLTLTLTAQTAKSVEPLAGTLPPATMDNSPATKAKRWAGGWRLQIPGLPTNRVSVIEPFTIHRKIVPNQQLGTVAATATQWEVPNIVFYMPPQDSKAWIAWHDEFVVQGNSGQANEKTFTLQLLTPDLQQAVLQLDGAGVGIVSAKYERPFTGNAPPTGGFRVELYVDTMTITSPLAAGAPGASPGDPSAPQTAPAPASKPVISPAAAAKPRP